MPKLYREAETEHERMTTTLVKMVIRDLQAEGDRDLGANLRGWLDQYGLTAAHFERWTSNPFHVERLTEECTRELYCLIRATLEGKTP